MTCVNEIKIETGICPFPNLKCSECKYDNTNNIKLDDWGNDNKQGKVLRINKTTRRNK